MPGQNYYLLSALPTLGDLGSAAPLTSGQLLDHVADAPGPAALIRVLLLSDDLLLREALLAGEVDDASPAVLTGGQLRDEQPLPAFLAGPEEAAGAIAADAVWGAYFRHGADMARKCESAFLAAWVAHEVAMRNALAAARAKALDLEAGPFLVAPDLAAEDCDFGALLGEWAAAPDPLAGLRVLDMARWAWLVERDGWFSFADDELAAYAAKLMLLRRWNRLDAAGKDHQPAQVAPGHTESYIEDSQ